MLFKNWCAQQKYIASAVIILFVTACDSDGGNQSTPVTAQAAASCGTDVFAAGTISREFTATTFNEPFVASDEAHVLIQLATAFADGPSKTLVEQDIAFAEIPFEFAICGNATEIVLSLCFVQQTPKPSFQYRTRMLCLRCLETVTT